jgi:hypothetical protein
MMRQLMPVHGWHVPLVQVSPEPQGCVLEQAAPFTP